MKRIIKLFSIIFLMLIFISNVKAENYKTGDLISYKNIKFYVISDNSDYLTLLKATPLTVDEVNKYGKEYVNKNAFCDVDQLHEMCNYYKNGNAFDLNGTGYGGVAYYSSDNCTHKDNDIDNDCKNGYNNSDIKHIVDEWSNSLLSQGDLKEVPITYTKDDNSSGSVSIQEKYKVRLLTKDEVTKLFSKIPTWLSRYTYWTMSPYGSSSAYYIKDGPYYNIKFDISMIYNISGIHGFTEYPYSPIGVRPVINLNKSASITKIKNNLKDINDTEFKIGDMIEYNGKEFYVLKDASKTDDKLTIITKLPLSYEELKNLEDVNYNTLDKGTMGLKDSNEYYPGYVNYYYQEGVCSSGHYDGCDNNYDKSSIKSIVDKWADKFFEDKLTIDEMGYKARLLTIDDLKDKLGYVGRGGRREGTQTESYQMSEEAPFALANCWTMTPVFDAKDRVYTIENNGNVFQSWIGGTKGVCPVVTIAKKVATNSNNNNVNKDNKVSIPDTLLKNPVFIVVIGIILIVVATITISLIIKKRKR